MCVYVCMCVCADSVCVCVFADSVAVCVWRVRMGGMHGASELFPAPGCVSKLAGVIGSD